jgi:dihydroorotate dehydrogenase/Pyruvate/2-oxoacid:ferredoxin oxidoreductase delta subunit
MKTFLAGIALKNPIVIASGPLTSSIDLLKRAEDNEAAGASPNLTFEKVPFPGKLRSHSLPGRGLLFGIDRRLNLDEGLELMRRGKEETSLVLMANITHPSSDLEKWKYLAREFEQAGADIIEANLTCPHIGLPAEIIGEEVREELKSGACIGQIPELCRIIVAGLKEVLRIPVVPKPFSGHPRFLETAKAIEDGGADGISISNSIPACLPAPDIYRKGKPGISLLDKVSVGIVTGNPFSKYSAFGRISQVRKNTGLQIVSSGGVAKWSDIVEMIMWGATAVGICTHLMWHGFEAIPRMLEGLKRYMEEQEIGSWDAIRGLALQYLTTPDELRVVPGAARIDPHRCNGCGLCLKPGHCVAILMKDGKASVEEQRCIGCSVCVNLCPKKAIQMEAI